MTYCNIHHCVRAYVGRKGQARLDLAVAGLAKDSMLLKANGNVYKQCSGVAYQPGSPPFPHAELSARVTTWSAWKAECPDGLVYIGEPTPPLRMAVPRSLFTINPAYKAAQACDLHQTEQVVGICVNGAIHLPSPRPTPADVGCWPHGG